MSPILKVLLLSNARNVILPCLNVNSIRNKCDNLEECICKNVYVLAVTETKIQFSFPSTQFFRERYHSPYRLDISHKNGSLLVYVKATIPCR